jgi:hypothetical protein
MIPAMSYTRPLFVALLLSATAAQADPSADAVAIDQRAALDCVTVRYRGEPLRIRDEDDGFVQEVRWRTPSGNVLKIELTGPGCRFIEVDGVGQAPARILPGQSQ